MEKQEFAKIAAAIKTYYPRDSVLPNSQAMELWYRQLQDIPYEVCEVALNKWVATNKWAPTIADLREMTSDVTDGCIDDWGKGWEQVLRAIRNYGSYEVQKAMDSFDKITRQCVQRIGFRNICMSENINADRANFRMIYEEIARKEKSNRLMPERLRVLISGMSNNQLLEKE